MPELPEVETVVRTLRPKVAGRKILRVELIRRDIVTPLDLQFEQHIQGRAIGEVRRRGKRIIFQLDDGNKFFIHLGMSGRLGMEKSAADRRRHTHLVIHFSSEDELRFVDPRRFGGVWWLGNDEPDEGTMGPEPLEMKAAELKRRFSKSKRPVKNALMDQRVVAGLGNIYVDESLFAAGIHPLRRADKLDEEEVGRLNRAIKTILRRAINHKGSTLRDYRDADGNEGAAQKLHRIYGRSGKACLNCKTPIERIVLGGRSTCFCLRCQPRHG